MISYLLLGVHVLQISATLAAVVMALLAAWHIGIKQILSGTRRT